MSHKPSTKFNGLLLAGGRSSRMGQDKALLSIHGETLLQRGQKLLKAAGAEQVFVSRNEFTLGYLPDVYPNKGPLSGIHAALDNSDLPLLVIPIDMPLLTKELLEPIVQAGLTMETAIHYVDHQLPLFVPNSRLVKEYLEKNLTDSCKQKRHLSIKRFLLTIGSAQLCTQNPEKLINTNTPEQWCQVLEQFID